MKAYTLSDQTTAIFDAYLGQHSTEIASIGSSAEDLLDNFEIAASYGLKYIQGDLTLSPNIYSAIKHTIMEQILIVTI